jgi:putative Holliday junction resolvase
MAVLTLPDLRAALPKGARLIGVDPGARVLGLALSDVTLTLASPYGSLKRGKLAATASELAAIARKEGAGGLVVGLPLDLDGSFGPAAQAAKDFGRDLATAAGLDVAFWDERLSTAAVQRAMIEADLSRAKRAARVDAAAAAWMLQAALDATAPLSSSRAS